MSVDRRRCTCPGQVLQVMDDLEAVIAADAQQPDDAAGGLHGDWVPGVPGCGEPPD